MFQYAGIIFAFIALVSWGFGDFFIQKTTRVVGSWKALFFIGIVGLIGLFPFVKNDLASLSSANVLLLCLLGAVVVFAALFDFEALRQGKIAIVEPIVGLELPITVGLSLTLANEALSFLQLFLIGIVFIGIMLAITAHHTHLHYHKRIFERGAILAGIGAIGRPLPVEPRPAPLGRTRPLLLWKLRHPGAGALLFEEPRGERTRGGEPRGDLERQLSQGPSPRSVRTLARGALHARVRALGFPPEGPGRAGARSCEAAPGFRNARAHDLFPADRRRGADGRAHGDRDQGQLGRVRRRAPRDRP